MEKRGERAVGGGGRLGRYGENLGVLKKSGDGRENQKTDWKVDCGMETGSKKLKKIQGLQIKELEGLLK